MFHEMLLFARMCGLRLCRRRDKGVSLTELVGNANSQEAAYKNETMLLSLQSVDSRPTRLRTENQTFEVTSCKEWN